MCTWRERFEQLSTAQSAVLESVKRAVTEDDRRNAVSSVKSSMEEISEYFREYELSGFPGHDEKMPSK